LFEEYGASLGFDLCFQNFTVEMAGLPGDYAPPRGALLLAVDEAAAGILGCVALRPREGDHCEMKRLYVRPAGRGLGTAKLAPDTLPGMARPPPVYDALGFRDIPPYRVNPIPGARYLELDLTR